jgi:hypothetical protein
MEALIEEKNRQVVLHFTIRCEVSVALRNATGFK